MSNITDANVTVTPAEGKLRIWRNTGLNTITADKALADNTVGYESNEDLDNGYRPPGLVDVSTSTGATPEYLRDFGSTVTPGTTTHHMTLHG